MSIAPKRSWNCQRRSMAWRSATYSVLACLVVQLACGESTRDPAGGAQSSTSAVHTARTADSLTLPPKRACVGMAVPKVQLTTYERCALRAFAARCTSEDSCMIRCLASGVGRNVGGGCWHLCYAYTGVAMYPLPPGQEVCEALSDSLPDSASQP